MKEYGYIYIIENLVNGKRYVGQTTNCVKRRIRQHFAGRGSELVYNAVKKYGIENFSTQTFTEDIENLDAIERDYIKTFNTIVPNGYNLESGGHKNKTASVGTRRKISQAKKGKSNPPLSAEHKRKLSEANKGRTLSAEHKRKLSEANKGKKRLPFTEEHKRKIGEAHKGKTIPVETRQKLSKALKGKKMPPRSAEYRRNISESKKGAKNPMYGKKNKRLDSSKQLTLF